MRGLKYAAGLVVAIVLHLVGVSLFDGFSQVVDLLLVVTLFNAIGGNLVAAMLGGLGAGLVTDAVTGSLYGLYGFADTIVGYGAAFAAKRLVIQRATGVWLVFSLAAAVQQALTMGLSELLLEDPSLPGFSSVAARVVTTGVIGVIGFLGHRRALRSFGIWRRNRTARLK